MSKLKPAVGFTGGTSSNTVFRHLLDSSGEHKVDDLLEIRVCHRDHSSSTKYLVKQRGYGLAESTWELARISQIALGFFLHIKNEEGCIRPMKSGGFRFNLRNCLGLITLFIPFLVTFHVKTLFSLFYTLWALLCFLFWVIWMYICQVVAV